MIGKQVVGVRNLVFGHVTGDAIPLRNGAEFCAGIRGHVTLLAFGIVSRAVLRLWPMRIVACNASDPRDGGVIAAAICETVELEPDIENAAWPVGCNIGPARMTLAAQIREFLGFDSGELWHRSPRGLSASYGCGVLRSACVALRTLHAGRQRP